ncbi:hypothetical protein [uncultured Duncaniella sp.]|uniref:hypothetical protein n=1 Tax=uncultured Duncaniella sp. TaxID=2768039 RepID=UPI0023D23253|nr:hypothetical protein [uncultured Duncaniella sp.]MDE6122390.1 hypothetical protein [Duncaniella dubosii]
MELKDKFNTAHDDFFGNVVGTIVETIKKTVAPKSTVEFVADWSLPNPSVQP